MHFGGLVHGESIERSGGGATCEYKYQNFYLLDVVILRWFGSMEAFQQLDRRDWI